MPQFVLCPECAKNLQVPDDLMGTKVQCPECRHLFTAVIEDDDAAHGTSVTSSSPPSPPASKPAKWDAEPDDRPKKRERDRDDDDDDDDRPRRRSRRDSRSGRDGCAPHRGGMILAFGLIGLIGGFAGAPLVFGILAWILGNNDLEEMRAGRMDPEGEGITQAGKVLGIIATILALAGMVIGCGFVVFWFLLVVGLMGGFAGAAPPPGKRP